MKRMEKRVAPRLDGVVRERRKLETCGKINRLKPAPYRTQVWEGCSQLEQTHLGGRREYTGKSKLVEMTAGRAKVVCAMAYRRRVLVWAGCGDEAPRPPQSRYV